MATRTSATKAKAAENSAAVSNNTEQQKSNETVDTVTEAKNATYKAKVPELDPNMYVSVRNGFNGKLIYKSRKTGERYVWEEFGDEQDIELRELRAAKTSYKAYFENNWFLIDDPDVIEYLGVSRNYADALNYEEFDKLFEMKPDEIEERISKLSKGQQASLKYRARQLVREGGIDSIKVINALERALGIELIEK